MEQKEQEAAAAAAAEAEAKAKADADAKAAADAAEAAKNKKTIGQVLDPKENKDGEAKTVPEAAFLELKKENKETKKALADLQRKIEAGASAEEVDADIEAIGKEFGVDEKFLNKLAKAIRKEADKDAEAKLQKTLGPIAEKEKSAKIDKIFKEHFDKAMAELPEYADIVNRDVIKSLSLDPSNQNKTFSQLIEETYGKALPAGKRTLETTVHRGGKSSGEIDYGRAAKDQKYFAEIMSDPDLKKEYNSKLTERVGGSL